MVVIKVVAIERQRLQPSLWIARTEDDRQLNIYYRYDSLFAEYEGDVDAIIRIDSVPPDMWADFEYMREKMLGGSISIPKEGCE